MHELSGDVAWTFDEFAAAASAGAGPDRRAPLREPRTSTARRSLAAGLDEGTVGFVLAMDANIADGLLADATDEVRSLIGRPTTPLVETLRTW